MLEHLKRFFLWLAGQPGFRSRLRYSDAEYFNLSDKDTRVATARREMPYPTLEQVKHVIAIMPGKSDLQRRDRALVAFTLLTGARDSAIASLKLKHVDIADGRVCQDAREVNTKNSKRRFRRSFFLWVMKFEKKLRSGSRTCENNDYGGTRTHCFPQPAWL
jgi:integrase/recombinase XerD